MKYIHSVRLKNFQSHIDSMLIFSGGLNVIVGPSDSGKTSIIRAIKWILYDEPQGDSVVRTGAEEAYVKIEMSDGSWIEKSRKKKKTVYVLYDTLTLKEEVFQGSRGNVKQRVADILGMRFDGEGGKTSFNIQEQLEAPFLLSSTGSIKAAAIGQLIGLDIIDDATQGTRADINSKKQHINRLLKEEERLDEILSQYEGLDLIRSQLDRTDYLLSRITQKKNEMEQLSDLSKKMYHLISQITDTEKRLDRYKNLDKWIGFLDRIQMLNEEYNTRVQLLEKKQLLEASIQKNIIILSDTKEVHNIVKIIEHLEKNLDLFSDLLELHSLLYKVKQESTLAQDVIFKTSGVGKIESLEKKIQEKNDLWEKLKHLWDSSSKIEYVQKSVKKINEKYSNLNQVLKLNDLLENRMKVFNFLIKACDEISDIDSRIEKGHLYLAEREKDIKEKTSEYRNLWAVEKRCPTCLRPISEHEMNEIMCEVEE